MTGPIVAVVLLIVMCVTARMYRPPEPSLADRIMQMARDMASLANATAKTGDAFVSTADAIDALHQALVGVADPIRRGDR